MSRGARGLLSWRRILLIVALFCIAFISVNSAAASKQADTTKLAKAAPQIASRLASNKTSSAPAVSDSERPEAPATEDAFLYLQPETNTPGSCPAPTNGGSTNVGCSFVLDLMLNAGSDPAANAQQSYLTFTNGLLQNVRVSSIGTGCVLTNTLTADIGNGTVGFDCLLQNEVCNGANPCVFRGQPADPGSVAYSSGALMNPPQSGIFRVARIGLCVTSPGTATLHWQFAPPDPVTRDTEIINENGDFIHNRSLFTDYVINITNPVLTGHVTWQGRPAQPDTLQEVPITLTLKQGTTEINYPAVTTDNRGFFTVSVGSLAGGTYNWRVKGQKYLANAGNVLLTGGPTTSVEMGSMRAGDANNDNSVNVVDFNLLRNSFGRLAGETGYDDRADFSGDQIVNVVDVSLHKGSMGQSGAPPIRPGTP